MNCQSAEDLYRSVLLEVTFEIKTLAFSFLVLESKRELARKNLDSITETHRLIEKRVSLGEVRELEAIKLYVEKLKAQNEVNKITTEIRLAKGKLNALLADSLPPDFNIEGELVYKPIPLEEEALVARALLVSPGISRKEKEVQASQSTLQYRKWQRLPDFTLSGFIQEELHGTNRGFGLTLDIPLWNFKSSEIAEAEYLLNKHQDELAALRLQTAAEVRARLSQLRLSEQTLTLFLSGLLKQAEQSLGISEVSYKQGEISLIDYLDSLRTYFSILKDYQDSLYTWNADKAALEKSIGEDIQ